MKKNILILTLLVVAAFKVDNAFSDDIKLPDSPAFIESDELTYDQKTGIVTANGNVKIIQGERILVAKEVQYDSKNNMVFAKGDISILEPDGTVLFAEEAELKDDLKKGVINNFSARLPDNALMSARKAEKISATKTKLHKLVYSPCPICKNDPASNPLWQIKAKEVTIDDEQEKVSYNNAFFEIKGVPVLYTPYLSHPTPNAKRKSGFLVPSYGNETELGAIIKTPYYWNISPNKDMTITPMYTANEGPVLISQYRHMIEQGSYFLDGSITNPRKIDGNGNEVGDNQIRGHVEGSGNFTLNDEWDLGFEGKRSSDDTYLRKYHFGYEDLLTSRLYTERFDDRDYTIIQGITFQGLNRNDNPATTPLILPSAKSHFEGNTGYYGSRWSFDADGLILTRDDGVNSNRISTTGGLDKTLTTSNGHKFNLATSLRGDAYVVDYVPTPSAPSQLQNGTVARIIPEAMLEWNYPLIKTSNGSSYYIEPVAQAIVSPHGNNPTKIPNEDSQDIEFSDEKLFNPNHYAGLDRIESGPRTNYGVRMGADNAEFGRTDFMFGQNYRIKRDPNFGSSSGINNYFSDYVGRVSYQFDEFLDFVYKFRLDNDDVLSSTKNFVSGSVNLEPVRFGMNYISLDANPEEGGLAALDREVINNWAQLDISEHWSINGSSIRDIENGEWINASSNLIYSGECINLVFTAVRDFTTDRDIKPTTTISFEVSLKGLN